MCDNNNSNNDSDEVSSRQGLLVEEESSVVAPKPVSRFLHFKNDGDGEMNPKTRVLVRALTSGDFSSSLG